MAARIMKCSRVLRSVVYLLFLSLVATASLTYSVKESSSSTTTTTTTAPKDSKKTDVKTDGTKKYITPLSNDDDGAVMVPLANGVRMHADLPAILSTQCVGCRTIPSTLSSDPLIVDEMHLQIHTLSSNSNSARLTPNDYLSTPAVRNTKVGESTAVVSVSSSQSGCVVSSPCYPSCASACMHNYLVSPVRVVTKASSSTCLPACMVSDCSVTCLRMYSIEGGAVSVESAPTFRTPTYVSDIHNSALQVGIVPAVVAGVPTSVQVGTVHFAADSTEDGTEGSNPAMKTVSTGKVSSEQPTLVHTVAASPCISSCMPACSTSCLHVVHTSPTRVVSSTVSSTCLPSCMSSGCSIACLRIYSPSFKEVTSEAKSASQAQTVCPTMCMPACLSTCASSYISVSQPVAVVQAAPVVSSISVGGGSMKVASGKSGGVPTQQLGGDVVAVTRNSLSNPPSVVIGAAPCMSACMPSCSAACVHVVHTSPGRVVSSTLSSTCLPACMSSGCSVACLRIYTPSFKQLEAATRESKDLPMVYTIGSASAVLPDGIQKGIVQTAPVVQSVTASCHHACMPSCEQTCTRQYVASGVSSGVPVQESGGDVVAVTGRMDGPCTAECMPSCSTSCVHVVHTSPVRLITSSSSSTCLPACMSSGCSAACVRMYSVSVNTPVGTVALSKPSNVGEKTADGMRVASEKSTGIPTSGGCGVVACLPTCTASCLQTHVVALAHPVPVALAPQFKEVGSHVLRLAESAEEMQQRQQIMQQQQDKLQQLQEQLQHEYSRDQARSLAASDAMLSATEKAQPNTIIIILVCGIVVVSVSVGVAVYMLVCRNKDEGYSSVKQLDGADAQGSSAEKFGKADANPDSDDAQAGGADGGNSIWKQRSPAVQDV